MKINLTGVNNHKNTTSNTTLRTMHGLGDSPSFVLPSSAKVFVT